MGEQRQVELVLGGGGVVQGLYCVDDGEARLIELRFSGKSNIDTTDLRSVSLTRLAQLLDSNGDGATRPDPSLVSERVGRAGRDDRYYAEWAAQYVQADSRRPVADLAERYGLKSTQVGTIIQEARSRGLLPSTKQGRAGGLLTQKARLLLR